VTRVIVDSPSTRPITGLSGIEVAKLTRQTRAVGLHRLETPFVGFMDGDDAPLSGALA
jgi:hypothetical protein